MSTQPKTPAAPDTPRTDEAAVYREHRTPGLVTLSAYVTAGFARTLETELAAMRQERDAAINNFEHNIKSHAESSRQWEKERDELRAKLAESDALLEAAEGGIGVIVRQQQAQIERLRALPEKWREAAHLEECEPKMALMIFSCARELHAALAETPAPDGPSDREMLDWLAAECFSERIEGHSGSYLEYHFNAEGATLRQAIAAAMKAS